MHIGHRLVVQLLLRALESVDGGDIGVKQRNDSAIKLCADVFALLLARQQCAARSAVGLAQLFHAVEHLLTLGQINQLQQAFVGGGGDFGGLSDFAGP